MNLYYAPDIAKTPFLPEEESLHCVKVLRQKAGDIIHLIDGVGGLYEARIVIPHQKRTEVEILNVTENYGKRNFKLHMAVAPTKNIDRFEWFLEKATEIGVDTFTPLNCRYSERRIVKPERMEKIVLSAAKQSLKAYLPVINPMIDFNQFIENVTETNRYIAHCYDMDKAYLIDVCAPKSDVILLVGPEGDFSKEEVQMALNNEFQSVSLGDARLRTETAGVVGCHLVNIANQKK